VYCKNIFLKVSLTIAVSCHKKLTCLVIAFSAVFALRALPTVANSGADV